jgi:hypothetical protein
LSWIFDEDEEGGACLFQGLALDRLARVISHALRQALPEAGEIIEDVQLFLQQGRQPREAFRQLGDALETSM